MIGALNFSFLVCCIFNLHFFSSQLGRINTFIYIYNFKYLN